MNDRKTDSKPEKFFKNIETEFLIHELKDPISIIETGARTLAEKQQKFGVLTPRQEKIVKRIARNAQKARDMLYGLLETGRSEAGSFLCNQFIPARTILEVLMDSLEIKAPQIADELRQYKDKKLIFESVNRFGIFLVVESEVQNLEMLQDEVKFRQIVGNLIKNALHFRKKRLELLLYKAGEDLILDVTDDGPGIPQDQRQSIFERYTQVKECALSMRNGHGLGLAGARIMARCLGGDIEIVSDKDKGTAFQLTLPINFKEQD